MFFPTSILANILNNLNTLRNVDVLNIYIFLQQNSQMLKNKVNYSIGLVIVCFSILILLWLPDLLRGKKG